MLGLGVFSRKPRQFNYRPLHFDPAKEARDERRRELLGDQALESDSKHGEHGAHGEHAEHIPGSYIRSRGFARRMSNTPHPNHHQRNRNIRRGIIAVVLMALLLVYILVTS